MADFEGIQLTGEGPACGCVLMLRASSAISRVVILPEGVEAEVRRGVSAIVVRGISATDHESVLLKAPELANRALDILAMTGVATMALADVWSCHAAWWPAPQATVIRIWCSATQTLKIQATAVVRDPDGTVRSPEAETTPDWHASMRYLRTSETTDDLFDAFRNVYLALESLLNKLQPRTPGENEGPWLRRALTWVHSTAGLEPYLRDPATDPVRAIYDELWKEVRNSIFHAKDPLTSFLPQDLARRTQVADAKDRYVQFYLDLAYREFGTRFRVGGIRLYSHAARTATDAMTSGCQIAFQADPSYEDPSGGPSLERPEITGLPTDPATDQRNASSSAVIARTPVLDLTGSAVVGRVFMFNVDGRPAFAQSLDGRLNLGGFDVCELLISLNVVGHQARKPLYATLSGCPNMATATPSARRGPDGAEAARLVGSWSSPPERFLFLGTCFH
jgi:hypothetical protein